MGIRNFKIIISYDGSQYFGFQRQKTQVTIQGVLEKTISGIVKTSAQVVGAGRTDAGVHALGQVISVKISTHLPSDILQRALNSVLPKDIRVLEVKEVSLDFHARHSARERHYQYVILNEKWGNPFWKQYSYHLFQPLNLDAMQEGASFLVGRHDFSAFWSRGDNSRSGWCNLLEIKCCRISGNSFFQFNSSLSQNIIVIYTHATNYLHSMIRNIVGTLIEVGIGKRIPREMEMILEKKDRRLAGPTVPPQGLYLVRVIYTDDSHGICPDEVENYTKR